MRNLIFNFKGYTLKKGLINYNLPLLYDNLLFIIFINNKRERIREKRREREKKETKRERKRKDNKKVMLN